MMKIISLTMNAFLAYKEKTIIDFEDMIDHGLYLISGPTGAGKTTIFDAITFALYGVASGSERNQAYFRSDFASEKDETYVELVFELHQHIYTIKRSPTYTRVGYKTAKNANAMMSYDDKVIEGVKEVNLKINELLGVDVHQFKQIVMIAQGEFTKLIYASSEEREKVLRHIFHSESLVSFENILKEETKKYKESYLLSSQQIISQFLLLSLPTDFINSHQDGFHPSYIDEAILENEKYNLQYLEYQKNDKVQKQAFELKSQTFYQQQKQNESILEYQRLSKQKQDLLFKKDYYASLQQDIHKLKVIEQNQSLLYQYNQTLFKQQQTHLSLLNIQKQYQDMKKEFIDIEKNYMNTSLFNQQKDQLLLEIKEIQQALLLQEKYQDINKQYQQSLKTCDTFKQQYQDLLSTHEKLSKRMERDQDNVNQLPDLQLTLQQNEQKVQEMNQRRISIHELSDLFDQYTSLQDNHFTIMNKYQKVSQEYFDIVQSYQYQDENFKQHQAGIIASSLQVGQPCPVCGSLEHPHKALLTTEVYDAKQLEELSQAVERCKEIKEDTYQEVLLENEHIQSIQTSIQLLKQQLHIEEQLSKEVFIQLLSNMLTYTQQGEKEYQNLYTEVEYLKKVKRSLEQDQLILQDQTKQLESTLEKIHTLEKELTSYQTQLVQFETSPYIHSLSLKEQYEEKQITLNKLEKQIKDDNENYHRCLKDLSLLEHQDVQLQEEQQSLNQLYSELDQQYQHFIQSSFQNTEEFHYYEKMIKTLQDKEKEYQDYLILQQTLSSQMNSLKDYQGLEIVDISMQKEELDILEKQREDVLKEINVCLHTYQQNQSLIQTIKKTYQQNQSIFEKYTMYQDLSDMTSGKNAQRLSFERYVLSAYFEHILEYANIEFLKMSGGRYALYRKQETKGAKQQGLDLSVLDYETGMMRDIQSLSGGESFKAALSLALGLSAMIQSYAGGIELNTLFIDEGFGSLDSESIDQALSVLLDLKNDNKVIGIISHVSELKERISTQIVVDKTKQGSFLHVEKD
ncbi:MAG: SMC family ATPase [Coprobacillus sp.]